MHVDPLLRDRDGAALLGVSVPTFWRRVADGTLPPPVKIAGASRWPQSDILEVIERAKQARRATDKRCGSCRWAIKPDPQDLEESTCVKYGRLDPATAVHCTHMSLPGAKQFVSHDTKMPCWVARNE